MQNADKRRQHKWLRNVPILCSLTISRVFKVRCDHGTTFLLNEVRKVVVERAPLSESRIRMDQLADFFSEIRFSKNCFCQLAKETLVGHQLLLFICATINYYLLFAGESGNFKVLFCAESCALFIPISPLLCRRAFLSERRCRRRCR